MHSVVQQVVDDGQMFEIMQDHAKNIITGELGQYKHGCGCQLHVAARLR
jgi:hypothetical protein